MGAINAVANLAVEGDIAILSINSPPVNALSQAVRAGIVRDRRLYPHTRVDVELEPGLRRCHELNVFPSAVRYARYDGRAGGSST